MKYESRLGHLKNRLLARSVPSCSHTSTIATWPYLQVDHSYHGGTIRHFNPQSVESWVTLWELELFDGALEDILCVRRGDEK
jgi:hypothetical protein